VNKRCHVTGASSSGDEIYECKMSPNAIASTIVAIVLLASGAGFCVCLCLWSVYLDRKRQHRRMASITSNNTVEESDYEAQRLGRAGESGEGVGVYHVGGGAVAVPLGTVHIDEYSGSMSIIVPEHTRRRANSGISTHSDSRMDGIPSGYAGPVVVVAPEGGEGADDDDGSSRVSSLESTAHILTIAPNSSSDTAASASASETTADLVVASSNMQAGGETSEPMPSPSPRSFASSAEHMPRDEMSPGISTEAVAASVADLDLAIVHPSPTPTAARINNINNNAIDSNGLGAEGYSPSSPYAVPLAEARLVLLPSTMVPTTAAASTAYDNGIGALDPALRYDEDVDSGDDTSIPGVPAAGSSPSLDTAAA
jgi:hypothetical protein